MSAPAFATPQSDAALIADRLMTSDFVKSLDENIGVSFGKMVTRWLSEHSVQVADGDRLDALLTDYARSRFAPDHKAVAQPLLLKVYDAEQFAMFADFLRGHPEGVLSQQSGYLLTPQPDQNDGATTSLNADDREAFLSLGVAMMGIGLHISLRGSSLDLDVSDPALIEVFATPGVLRFPNRIFQRNFLRDLQSGALDAP